MSMSRSQNLLGPLDHVTARYRDRRASPRSMRIATVGQRIDQLSAYVDLSVDEPKLVRSLHDTTAELRDAPSLDAVLPEVLEGALS